MSISKLLVLAAVFTAGYLWGADALDLVCGAWQDMAEASRIKLEEYL